MHNKFIPIFLFLLTIGFTNIAKAQPVQIELMSIKQIKPDQSNNKNIEYNVTINGKSLTKGSWMVLPDQYLKITIQIQQTKAPKVFGMKTKYINIKKLEQSDTNIVIPIKARTYNDPPDHYSYIWIAKFHIST